MSRWYLGPILIGMLSGQAAAVGCPDAKPFARFSRDAAMAAVFCGYRADYAALLWPAELTAEWRLAEAEALLEPIQSGTFELGGAQLGILAVARQPLYRGEAGGARGEGAVISIYRFVWRGDANALPGWVLREAEMEVTKSGSWGQRPDAEFVRIGLQRHALALRQTQSGQGATLTTLRLLEVAPAASRVLGDFELAGDNAGSCPGDSSDRADASLQPCVAYASQLDFEPIPGEPYFLLRQQFSGTDLDAHDRARVVDRVEAICLAVGVAGYEPVPAARCSRLAVIEPD